MAAVEHPVDLKDEKASLNATASITESAEISPEMKAYEKKLLRKVGPSPRPPPLVRVCSSRKSRDSHD